jgi:hypothetical protein
MAASRHAPRPSLPGLVGLLAARAALGVIYWAVVTPIGLALRASGRTPLDVLFRAGKSSYWIAKEPRVETLIRYEKPY